ncbi:hypothetical protein OOT00_06630 [Desulfobotulus sp. H1]|uniref:Uncharacterized protein n=1 Tax=Desulfobotulus pelophilus TaxID=2823377 RepID=A0ABT3N884_9BACT|nr:hypothetical protein [Desulfobotulus pelophilus]MCW7753658.1 hypothetical protein [Desulfobotulus pelophilus]
MDMLYFPFLDMPAASIGYLRSLFPRLFILHTGGSEMGPDAAAAVQEGWLVPLRIKEIDPSFMVLMKKDLEQRAAQLGKEAVLDLFSPKEEPEPSPWALSREMRGEVRVESPEFRKGTDSLALSAFFLMQAEAFDRAELELAREMRKVDDAHRHMMAALAGGVGDTPGNASRFFSSPCRPEQRMRAWLRLFQSCNQPPFFWVTDFPDAAEILIKLFPSCAEIILPDDASVPYPDLPENGILLRLNLNNDPLLKTKPSELPEVVWVYCLGSSGKEG